MAHPRKVVVVFGGGGVRGLAHVGVLKVLARHGLDPDVYVGTSVGAIIAALAAGGMDPLEIEKVALAIVRQDFLDYDWWGLLLRRGHNRSLYKGDALHDWIRRTLPVDRFDQLKKPAFFTGVDVESGRETVWGAPGLRDVPIHDAVTASCAIPGVYPPKEIAGRWYVDGSMADPLPIKVAATQQATLVLAVYLDRTEVPSRDVQSRGLMGIVERGHTLLSRSIFRHNLDHYSNAPMVLIEPEVESHGLFQFDHTEHCIRAGELAAEDALGRHPLLRDYAVPVARRGGTPSPENGPKIRRPDTHAHGHGQPEIVNP